ncbi:hypothetical protein L1887_09305 [Cichorium endivia]|nr:hypothetical protein L1887_09305 [Cichorium endivia]
MKQSLRRIWNPLNRFYTAYRPSTDYNTGQSVSQSISENSETTEKEVSSVKKKPSVSDLENKGASMLLKDENGMEEFRRFPYLYSEAGDLTVGDVENLLDGYKELVLKYVSLAKGLEDK